MKKNYKDLLFVIDFIYHYICCSIYLCSYHLHNYFQHCGYIRNHLRIHWRLLATLKTSIKSVWSNDFLICKIIYNDMSKYIFFSKSMNSITLNHHNSFQSKNNRKTTDIVLLPNLNKKLQQEVWKFSDEFEPAWVGTPQKLSWR